MFIGGRSDRNSLRVGNANDWDPGPGSVVTWEPTAASVAHARRAPISPVPPSAMQAGHLRGYVEFKERGLDYSRTVMGSWDVPGRCDIRAMTYVLNAHIRRHATYHSWFEHNEAKQFVRHTIEDPRGIQFVAKEYGAMTQPEMARSHPGCARSAAMVLLQVRHHPGRAALHALRRRRPSPLRPGADRRLLCRDADDLQRPAGGQGPAVLPPAASYDEFCLRESRHVSSMTLDSPKCAKWIGVCRGQWRNAAGLSAPDRQPADSCGGNVHVRRLLSAEQTVQFETICRQAGVRFSGGLFACAALTHHVLSGADTYYGLTPIDKRKTPADFMTVGWFTGVVPFTVPVAPTSFAETARAAQASFDANMDLANVPYDRVLELAPWLRRPGPSVHHDELYGRGSSSVVRHGRKRPERCERGSAHRRQGIRHSSTPRLFRLFDEVSIMVSYPNNPLIAANSVNRFTETMKSVFLRALAGGFGQDVSAREHLACAPGNWNDAPMKFVLAAHGTRGDVEPCAVVGLELQRRGHTSAWRCRPTSSTSWPRSDCSPSPTGLTRASRVLPSRRSPATRSSFGTRSP